MPVIRCSAWLGAGVEISETTYQKHNMPTELSLQKAAQAWCKPTTSVKTMDPELAEAFAEILDDIWSKPWLGNATTGELLDELRARCEVNGTIAYRTTEAPNPKLSDGGRTAP